MHGKTALAAAAVTAGGICAVLFALHREPYGSLGNTIAITIYAVSCCALPLAFLGAILWGLGRSLDADALDAELAKQRYRARAGGDPTPSAEMHTLLVVIPANADPPVTTPALLKWLSMTLTAPAQVHYVRSPIAGDVDRRALVGETLAAAMPSRAAEEPTTAAYRESAASPGRAPAVRVVRVLGLSVATGATHTTSAPPARLDDARALLHAIGPHTEGAPCAVRMIPEASDDALEPHRVAELIPQLARELV